MSKTILLADDSVTIQKVVELTFMDQSSRFMDQDFRLVTVGDGRAAMDKLAEIKPDLIIADVHMPEANGYEVCHHAKQRYPEVPVLLLIGTFEPFVQSLADKVGADSHLEKPFDSRDFLREVEKLLTLAMLTAPALETAPRGLDTASRNPTILLADDSVTIQKVVELTFMDRPRQVVSVSDGLAALRKLTEMKPDIIIADVHMPGADGYEVCHRAKQRYPETPVLLLVGTFEPFDQETADRIGANGCFKKPFDSQDLIREVDTLLKRATPPELAAVIVETPPTSFEPAPSTMEPPAAARERIPVANDPIAAKQPPLTPTPVTDATSQKDLRSLLEEKLKFLQLEEVKLSDPAQKYSTKKHIEEVEKRLLELQQDATKPTPGTAMKIRPTFSDSDLRRHSTQLTLLYQEKRARTISREDTRTIDGEIRRLRAELRRGPNLNPGQRLLDGRFELIDPLGRGGFGHVWRAWDEDTHRCVAIKILLSHLIEERSKLERFLRGARWMSQLRHPHIVAVYEPHLIDEDGWHFFVMEWIDGTSLDRATFDGRLEEAAKLRIILQAGEALSYAHSHEKRIIHRDIKPANILLDKNLQAKITDFDLVRADDTEAPFTQTHAMMGTLNFSAPELLHSPRTAGPPADVYSLASTAVFALSDGKLPAGYYKDPKTAIIKLGIRSGISELLIQATAEDPKARYPTAKEFIHELKSIIEKLRLSLE